MKRGFGAALLLAMSAPAASADTPSATERCQGGAPDDCRRLLAATAALTQMLVTGDPAPLIRYLDPRAIWVGSDGSVRPAVELAALVRGDRRRASARLERATARFYGDTAVVEWAEHWSDPGADVASGRLAGIDTWARRGGAWRIVATVEQRAASAP